MKQNRTIKRLIPCDNRDGKWFTILLLILSVILCLGSASLMTVSVGAAGDDDNWFIPYTGHDDNTEVLYKLEFSDLDNLGGKATNEFYLDKNSIIVTPNSVRVEDNTGDAEKYVNFLGGEGNEVNSDNITIIAGLNNNISSGNDNASVLGGEGNSVIGDSHGTPVVVAGGLTNKVEDGKGDVVLGGNENIIRGSSSSIVLGGKRNEISGGKNIIIGGENVKVSGISNIFAFSDSDFQPESSGAFYLNLAKGVGINSVSEKEGMSVSGTIGFGDLDIEHVVCNEENIGVEGSWNGCLVGCTAESFNVGKWELLDRGSRCEELCNNDKCIYKVFTGLQEIPDYTGFCITEHIDVSNATRCTTGENESYENVVFEGVLIDYEAVCPTSGNNKCVYKCNPETHLTGDVVGGTNEVMCYKDCEYPWDSTKKLKHNETITGYNIEDVTCSNDVYVFPYQTEIINKPVSTYQVGNKTINGITYKNRDKDGKSFESCGNYDHKKTLVCLSGSLYLLKSDGKADMSTKVEAEAYKYESCNLHDYRCDTGVYSLTKQQIEDEKKDKPANASGNREVADREILTGERGQYKLCVDYNASPSENGESCVTDGVSPTAYHYQFLSCQDGYHTGAGYENVCMKDCNLKKSDGSNEAYRHMGVATGYQATGAICTGTCLAEQIVCNDGTWRLGSLDGVENMQYLYSECDLKDKVCSTGDYNVEQSVVTNSGQHSIYESCDPYEASGMFECVKKDTVNKLVGCEEEYHTENNLYCEPNQKEVNCAYITGKYGGSGKYIDANVTVEWTGEWNNGIWTTPLECEWKCNEGYHLSGFVCVSNVMEVDCRKNGKPDNSYYIEGKEFILWSASDGWPSRPNCDWKCDDEYVEVDGECVHESELIVTLNSGPEVNNSLRELADGSTPKNPNTSIKQIVRSENQPGTGLFKREISIEGSKYPVVVWADRTNGIIYYYTVARKIYLNPDSSKIFSTMINLENLDLNDFDTSKVSNMSNMFAGTNISKLDFSNFDTSGVNDMSSMFDGIVGTGLNVSNFDTSRVANMSHMFARTKLTTLDLSNFDTRSVNTMNGMFYSNSDLQELDVSSFDTSNVKSMASMFEGCSSLKNLDLSGIGWNTSSVENMSCMFRSCKILTELDVSRFDTSRVTDMSSMFDNCMGLKKLDLTNFVTSGVTDMSSMFKACSELTDLDLSSFNTSNVSTMRDMFYALHAMTGLDLSTFNTSKVTDMSYMFYISENLEKIFVGTGFDTSKVEASLRMFCHEKYAPRQCPVNLEGGSGTVFDITYNDKTYARIDQPSLGLSGYFTLKQ